MTSFETKLNSNRFFIFLILFGLILSVNIQSQSPYPLLQFDFTGISGQSSAPAFYIEPGISSTAPSGVASLGSGVIPERWYLGNGLSGRCSNLTLEQSIQNNRYITFTLTPTPNTTSGINITSVSFTAMSHYYNRKFALLSSVNGFNAANLIDSITVQAGQRVTFNIPNHTNITVPVEFRLYVYGIEEMWVIFGVGCRSASENSDLTVYGSIPDNQAPAVPTGLQAKDVTTSYVNLTWNPSTDNIGVNSYDIYQNGVLVGNTKDTKVTIGGLIKSTNYTFSVKAKDSAGNQSSLSDAISVTTTSVPLSRNNIGINLSHPADWGGDHAFTDVMKLARAWWKLFDYSAYAPLDENGWPTTDASVCVWHGIGSMNGTYKLKFTGSCTNIYAGWGTTLVTNKVYNAATNTTTADISYLSTGGDGLLLSFEGTNGGVKNVQLMAPLYPGSTSSYDFNSTFTNQIKSIISKFSAIRFLDWDYANGSYDSLWVNRTKTTQFRGSLNGAPVPWETMIKLCNETHTDAWINVSARADSVYIRNLAKLWKDSLNPDLKLYVEYSNEVWNGSFTQCGTNYQQAQADISRGNSNLNFDGETNTWYFAWRRVAQQTVRISNIFREVWGDANMISRVRPVLMWQQGNAQSTAMQQVLWLDNYCETTNRPVNYYIYGAGGSAYYYPDNSSDNLTIDNFWTSMTNDIENWRSNNLFDIALASAIGCKRLAYEGGPSYDPTGHSEAVKQAAWNDARILNSVYSHHNMWSQYGGDLLMYYATTGGYSWGFSPNSFNIDTYKYRAIDQLNASDKFQLTIGVDAPFTIDGNAFDYANPNYQPKGIGTAVLNEIRSWKSYMFKTDSSIYTVKLQYTNCTNGVLQLIVDGEKKYEINLNGTGYTQEYPIALQSGLHNLRLRLKNNGTVGISTITVTKTNEQGITTGRDILNYSTINVYPNPVNGSRNVTIKTSDTGLRSIRILDLTGKTVYLQNGLNTSNCLFTLPDAINSGIYMMLISTEKSVSKQKLIVN